MSGLSRSLREVSVVVLLSLLSTAAGAQRHERKRAERAEIGQLEQQWRMAQISDDIPEMDKLLSEDFLGVTAGGQVVTKAQQLDRMRSREIDLRRLDLSETKIKISGSLAVVTSLAQIDGTMEGRPVDGFFRYTRVYQRGSQANWRITNFEATRVPGGNGANASGGFHGSRGAAGSGAVTGASATLPPAGAAGPRAGGPNLLPASQARSGSPLPPS